MTIRAGINGFGRIGRNFFRAVKQRGADIDFVAANDLGSVDTMAHLLKYDSVMGRCRRRGQGARRRASRSTATIIKILAERDPGKLPWGDLGVDVVIESTGFFTNRRHGRVHLDAGAPLRHRLRARPPTPTTPSWWASTTTPFDPAETTSSPTPPAPPTASCRWSRSSTTPSASSKGLMTTVHAYTGDQQLVDGPHRPPPGPRRRHQHRADLHRRRPGHQPRAASR